MSSPGRICAFLLLLGALVFEAAPGSTRRAWAAEPEGDAFQARYDRAVKLYEDRLFEAAITEFQAAYVLRQLPRLLLNIGQAYRKLERPRNALVYYERFLQVNPEPDPVLKTRIDEYMAQARAQIAAQEEPPPSGPPPRPWYRHWWLWTGAGVLVAAGVTGLAVGLTRSQPACPEGHLCTGPLVF